ncbi:hypothetical protein B0H10DRAFT_1950199 [Mycena sp. CBHHK59/15]|nr:hypothetical protein B0H10DRAFT_1950199 [Mycena sp. CBHHK59/15]
MGDISGHLVVWDGSDLPTTRDPGGVAAILRQRARENTNRGNTAALSAQYDRRSIISGTTFSVSTNDASLQYADPALCSGRNTSSCQEPYVKPAQKPKASSSKNPAQNSNPLQLPMTGTPLKVAKYTASGSFITGSTRRVPEFHFEDEDGAQTLMDHFHTLRAIPSHSSHF